MGQKNIILAQEKIALDLRLEELINKAIKKR